jgi:hypothetical protein
MRLGVRDGEEPLTGCLTVAGKRMKMRVGVRGGEEPLTACLTVAGKMKMMLNLRGGEEPLTACLTVAGKDEDEVGFERGSTRRYTFQVGKKLGDLRRLHVQQVSPRLRIVRRVGILLRKLACCLRLSFTY